MTDNLLPDYDAGVLARELGLDPDQVTRLAIHVEARWIVRAVQAAASFRLAAGTPGRAAK